MSSPALSVVVPVYNEAGVVCELTRRLLAVAEGLGQSVEVIVVNDASTDATATLLAGSVGLRVLNLEANVGQFRATCAGLAAATGERVAVLDGDLQDPPESLPELVAALGDGELAFAVKTQREDPLWFLIGRAGYRALAALGRGTPPSGAGSYCVMQASLAKRIAASPYSAANLSSVAVSFARSRGPWPTVGYAKAARYDGRSRVGLSGLVAEALGSLRVTGALSRILWLGAVIVAVGVALRLL